MDNTVNEQAESKEKEEATKSQEELEHFHAAYDRKISDIIRLFSRVREIERNCFEEFSPLEKILGSDWVKDAVYYSWEDNWEIDFQ